MRPFSAAFALAIAMAVPAAQAAALVVGSKRFTESYILAEIAVGVARRAGAEAEHRPGLGNTAILVEALRTGAIHLYPEYTGTIAREVLRTESRLELGELNARLAPLGLRASVPLGFANTYAIGMRRADAERLGLRRVSDLAAHPGLRAGFSHEFLGRADGWNGLRAAYRLGIAAPRGLDHGLAYEALAAREIDLMDVYSTDAKIARYDVTVLEDDRAWFPRYDAVLLHRLDAAARAPAAFAALAALEGRIDARAMIALNAGAELEGRSFREVAAGFLGRGEAGTRERSLARLLFGADSARLTAEHLVLVLASLAAAVAAGVPLGVAAARRPRLGQAVFAAVGIVQTVPSLAMLAFLIALTGTIGTLPALAALFLYALLPIVRGTHAGLESIGPGLRQAALALGLSPREQLRRIELPLALPAVLAGVKTSAVINVGTATIAAFVGAGGYGERIAAGLALNDATLLLAGAIPAAALALAVQGAFEWAERRFGWMRRARV